MQYNLRDYNALFRKSLSVLKEALSSGVKCCINISIFFLMLSSLNVIQTVMALQK